MMYQLLIILSFFLLPPNESHEQDTPGRYEQRALDILAIAHTTFNTFDAFYAEFDYSSANSGFSTGINDSGFLYTSGKKYRMQLDGSLFVSDGITAWSFLEEINEVHISDVLETNGIITPTSLLEHYQDDFQPLWIRQELHRGKKVEVIDLVPEDPHTAFSKYRIAIEAESGMIAYVVAYDRQGGTYSYIITSTNTSPEISDSIFTFDPNNYPGIEVIDLR